MEVTVNNLNDVIGNCKIKKIIEIGAVKIKNENIGDSFHTFIKQDTPIPPFIKHLTGVSNDVQMTYELVKCLSHLHNDYREEYKI